jgi:hypothetical protein
MAMIASLAVLAATAVFAAPVGAGTFQPAARSGEGELHMVADTREGAWLWYPGADGHEQLRKISETGAISTVALPPQLQSRGFDLAPLPGGWMLATNHLRIAGRERFHCCQSLVVAQRSPTGRWTRPQAISSLGSLSGGATAVEIHGHLLLGWNEFASDAESTLRLARAPLGGRFARSRVLGALFAHRRERENSEFGLARGRLYAVSTSGPALVERQVLPSGTLGARHYLISGVLAHSAPQAIPEPDGAEVWAYETGGPDVEEKLFIAYRAPGSRRLVRPERVVRYTEDGFQVARAPDGRSLLTIRSDVRAPGARFTNEEPSQIMAAVISPTGKLSLARRAAFDPQIELGSYDWTSAIDDRGDQLVATAESEGDAALWASVASARCPAYSPRTELSTSHERSQLAVAAGAHGAFHLAWVSAEEQVESTTASISCAPPSGR